MNKHNRNFFFKITHLLKNNIIIATLIFLLFAFYGVGHGEENRKYYKVSNNIIQITTWNGKLCGIGFFPSEAIIWDIDWPSWADDIGYFD